MSKIAVILIRGLIGTQYDIIHTLKLLNLTKKNALVLIEDTPINRGMLQKVKDYTTWGLVNDETVKALKEKSGEQKIYNLHPPRGGFERKGTKTPYSMGGALGNRKEAINALIKKML